MLNNKNKAAIQLSHMYLRFNDGNYVMGNPKKDLKVPRISNPNIMLCLQFSMQMYIKITGLWLIRTR